MEANIFAKSYVILSLHCVWSVGFSSSSDFGGWSGTCFPGPGAGPRFLREGAGASPALSVKGLGASPFARWAMADRMADKRSLTIESDDVRRPLRDEEGYWTLGPATS